MDMELTEQERQLIEVIRENAGNDGFRLHLYCQNGAWEVSVSAPLEGKIRQGRGVGADFAAAWDDMSPGWA